MGAQLQCGQTSADDLLTALVAGPVRLRSALRWKHGSPQQRRSTLGGPQPDIVGMAHLIAVVFAIGFPAVNTPGYAKRHTAILKGDLALKRREYAETIAWLSGMGLASVGYFLAKDLDLSLLGLAIPGTPYFFLALGLAMPLWMAVILTSLLFGLAHVMHGVQAAVRSSLMGLLLAGLYLLGGSLLAPMVLHTAVDLSSGEAGAMAFAEVPEEPNGDQ